jgi:hypothetical protein
MGQIATSPPFLDAVSTSILIPLLNGWTAEIDPEDHVC